MKKILLATTLLASTAGFAAADVAVSGSARMGLYNNGSDTLFSSRVRIVFTGSGTTDGGLTFGASMRADQSGGNSTDTQTSNGSSTAYISGAFGKLTFGDVANGAGDDLVGQISYVGYTSLQSLNEIAFLANTATGVRYDYTSGNLSVALGADQTTALDGADKNSIAVKYATDMYNVAVSYEKVTGDSMISAKGGVTFGAATVTAKYAKADSASDAEFGVSLDYAVSPALKLTAFYTDHKATTGNKVKGIGASYDLGGGASVLGGVVDTGETDNNIIADVGVTMSF